MLRRFLTIALTLAACAASCASAGATDLAKGISLMGPQSLRSDGHPNDYRLWGNADYVTSSHTSWVKLWVPWADLQEGYPQASLADSWRQLGSAPGGASYLHRWDAQIRAANADGIKVILTLYQANPTWATGATGSDPLSTKPAIQKLPLDLSPDGPWGWFVAPLSARYDGSYNATGPHAPGIGESAAVWRGNPAAAQIDALEVVNEPNLLYWPQEGIAENTATMIRSAEELSYRWGRQPLLVPATSDHPDPGAATPGVNTDWQTFTSAVLTAFAGWQPRVPVHWSHHNYKDV